MDRNKYAGFDLDITQWSIWEYLSTITFIIFILGTFSNIYAYSVINIRITLFLVGNIFIVGYNYIYTLGALVGLTGKDYYPRLLLPYAVWVLDIIAMFILSQSFAMGFNIYGYLVYFVVYSIHAITQALTFKNIDVVNVVLSEDYRTILGEVER